MQLYIDYICIIQRSFAHYKLPCYPPALAAERIYKARAEICHPFTPTAMDKWRKSIQGYRLC